MNELILAMLFSQKRQETEWYLEDMISAAHYFKNGDRVVDEFGNIGDVVWSNASSTCVLFQDGNQHFRKTGRLMGIEEYLKR